VPQDVTVAVTCQDAEVGFAGGVPAIFDRGDFENALAKVEAQGTLVGFEAGVTLYVNE